MEEYFLGVTRDKAAIFFQIDRNGHGGNTPGKRSPDGRFREYKYNREIARAVVEHLQLRGYDAQLLVPEEEDIPLKERVLRGNKLSCQIGHPIQETIIISIHVNAAGNGLRPFLISTKIAIFEFLFH